MNDANLIYCLTMTCLILIHKAKYTINQLVTSTKSNEK